MEENTLKEEKVIRIINYINENGCVPKKDTNKELAYFYNGLKHSVKLAKEKEQQGKKLNKFAIKNIEYYQKIQEALLCHKERKSEQVEELISFINQHQTLPKRDVNKDLFIFYTFLQQSARKAKERQQKGKKLGEIAIKNLKYYNEIEEALLSIRKLKEEKIKELIQFVKKNQRLPRFKRLDNNQGKYLYNDEREIYSFYKSFIQMIKILIRKEKQGILLTEEELMYLEYNEILEKELAKYKITKEEKVNELIEFIETNHRLPYYKRYNNNQSEKLYRDNTDMSNFYLTLCSRVNIIKQKLENGKTISSSEKESLEYFKKIQQALSKYRMTQDEKLEILINYIKENHSLPVKRLSHNQQRPHYQDNTDMKNYYLMLSHKATIIKKKIKNKEPLTEKDLKNLEDFNKIRETLEKYRITKKQKLELLIKFINEYHRLPKPKSQNNGVSEVSYEDKTDMRKFYSSLLRTGKKAIEKEQTGQKLTKKEQENKESFLKVRQLLDFYSKLEIENNNTKERQLEKIFAYLEELRNRKCIEEIILFQQVIIETNNLDECAKQRLNDIVQKYILWITKNSCSELSEKTEHIKILSKSEM